MFFCLILSEEGKEKPSPLPFYRGRKLSLYKAVWGFQVQYSPLIVAAGDMAQHRGGMSSAFQELNLE